MTDLCPVALSAIRTSEFETAESALYVTCLVRAASLFTTYITHETRD